MDDEIREAMVAGNVFPDLEHAIGKTPLIRLRRASEITGCEIWGKCEFLNPVSLEGHTSATGMRS